MANVESPQNLQGGSPGVVDRKKARKRELDRISQQRKRKNDRETISKLKSQVKALANQSDDSDMINWIRKHEKGQEKIKRHLERAKLIEALIKEDLDELNTEETSHTEVQNVGQLPTTDLPNNLGFNSNTSYLEDSHVGNHSTSHLDAMTWDELTGVSNTISPDSNKESAEEYMDLEDMSSFDPNFINENSHIPKLPSLSLSLEPHRTDWALQSTSGLDDIHLVGDDACHRCESMWRTCDTAIVQGRSPFLYSGNDHGCDEGDAHLIISAIADGWDKATKSRYWNAHWNSLRQIDQFCHSMCGPVERMSSLYTLIRLFKYQRFPGDPRASELPAFLRARPSQLHVPHAAVIDHFIWPGFREHLVFDHQKYHNNAFSNDYGLALRFIWPYELRDTYMKNKMTGLYQFSTSFIERAEDLRCYTMKSQFFAKYPEFQGDVPVFDPAPRMMPASGGEKPIFYHFSGSKGAIEERMVEEVVEEEEPSRILA